jgi:phytoene dehydrogenase-like protein
MSPDQLGEHRPALNGLVKNLYFTGHWTQPGGGITPVIVSAMQVAKRIIDRKDASCADLYPSRVLSASGEAFANVA